MGKFTVHAGNPLPLIFWVYRCLPKYSTNTTAHGRGVHFEADTGCLHIITLYVFDI